MRVALIHDYLNQWGGAERARVLAEMFPDADIYTLFHDSAALGGLVDESQKPVFGPPLRSQESSLVYSAYAVGIGILGHTG